MKRSDEVLYCAQSLCCSVSVPSLKRTVGTMMEHFALNYTDKDTRQSRHMSSFAGTVDIIGLNKLPNR